MTVLNGIQATGGSAVMVTAQRLAAAYAEAREQFPELPASYQSARPWFILLGRAVASASDVERTLADNRERS